MNKVLSWHPQPYGDYQLGYCRVDMGGKATMILKVCKSKTGSTFCTAPSVKIDDQWQASFAFSDQDKQKEFMSDCLQQLAALMQPEPQQEEEKPPFQEDPNLPF